MAWNDHPQSARGWLYILAPTIVMKARVNMASVTYPLAAITYDGASVGTYSDINIGQTILIGSSDGAYDLGRTYLRASPTSSSLPIGWSSRGTRAGEVDATDNAYITVLDTYEVWKKVQRLDHITGELYKDYDLNGTTPPSPIMQIGDLGGLGRVGFCASSGGVLTLNALNWGGSALVNAGETWTTRNWEFAGGNQTVGTTTTQSATVEFTAGKRWIRLFGEGSGGGYTYRRYLVVALDPADPDTVKFNGLKIKRTAEGQTLTADLQEYLDPAIYLPGTIALYLAREKRGSTVTIVQRFAGWLDTENNLSQATRTYTKRGATITAVDVSGKLAQLKAMPTMVANEAAQDSWLDMKGANPDRYIHRELAFGSTALSLSDLTLSGSSAYPVRSYSTTGGMIYGVCDSLARAFARRLTCDSNGRLAVKLDPLRQDTGDRTATVQRHFGESDWAAIKVAARARASVGVLKTHDYVISSGYASVDATPYPDVFSVAPGEAAGQGGGDSSVERGIVVSQTEANARIGHDYARMTAPEGLYTLESAHGVDADIEPANMTWVTVTAAAGSMGYRGRSLSTTRGLPISVELAVNAETGVSTQSFTWEREVIGTPGVRDPKPTASDSYVPPTTPPIQPPARDLIYTLRLNTGTIAAFTTGNKLLITRDATTPDAAGGPTWASTDLTGLANWGGGTLIDFTVDPFSPLYLATGTTVNGWIMTTTKVQRITDIFGTVALGTAHSLPMDTVAGSLRTERGTQNWLIAAQYGSTGTKIAYSTNGTSWTNVTVNTNVDANYFNNSDSWTPGIHISPHTAGKAYISAFTAGAISDGFVTTDYGATWAAISNPNISPSQFPVRSIAVPYADMTDTTVYYGNTDIGVSGVVTRLSRAIGASSVDISPAISGKSFGVGYVGRHSPRAVSVSDSNRQLLVLCGIHIDLVTGDLGHAVFWTDRAETVTAGSSDWNVLVNTGTTLTYTGCYVVDGGIFLIGVGFARWDGQVFHDMSGDMALAGASIKGICGG